MRSRSPTAGVRLGAMVRWRDILDDARLATAHPLLVAAVKHVAHYQIRNRGTVGGSIAHADPAAEMPGIVVACDAEIAVTGKAGARVIAAKDFFLSRADHRARAGRDHHRDPPAGVAGRAPLRLRGIRAAARRFRHRGGGRVLRPRRGRPRRQCPCRRDRRRRPADAAAVGRGRAQRRAGRRRRDRQGGGRDLGGGRRRRTTSMPAPPIAARWSAPWSSARSSRRPGEGRSEAHADEIRSQRQAGRGRTSSRA